MIGRIVKHGGKSAFKSATRVGHSTVRHGGTYAAKHIAGKPRKHVGKGVGYSKYAAKKGFMGILGKRPRYKRSFF